MAWCESGTVARTQINLEGDAINLFVRREWASKIKEYLIQAYDDANEYAKEWRSYYSLLWMVVITPMDEEDLDPPKGKGKGGKGGKHKGGGKRSGKKGKY